MFTGAQLILDGSQVIAILYTVPLSNAATTIMFEGIPNYPDSSRWWQVS